MKITKESMLDIQNSFKKAISENEGQPVLHDAKKNVPSSVGLSSAVIKTKARELLSANHAMIHAGGSAGRTHTVLPFGPAGELFNAYSYHAMRILLDKTRSEEDRINKFNGMVSAINSLKQRLIEDRRNKLTHKDIELSLMVGIKHILVAACNKTGNYYRNNMTGAYSEVPGRDAKGNAFQLVYQYPQKEARLYTVSEQHKSGLASALFSMFTKTDTESDLLSFLNEYIVAAEEDTKRSNNANAQVDAKDQKATAQVAKGDVITFVFQEQFNALLSEKPKVQQSVAHQVHTAQSNPILPADAKQQLVQPSAPPLSPEVRQEMQKRLIAVKQHLFLSEFIDMNDMPDVIKHMIKYPVSPQPGATPQLTQQQLFLRVSLFCEAVTFDDDYAKLITPVYNRLKDAGIEEAFALWKQNESVNVQTIQNQLQLTKEQSKFLNQKISTYQEEQRQFLLQQAQIQEQQRQLQLQQVEIENEKRKQLQLQQAAALEEDVRLNKIAAQLEQKYLFSEKLLAMPEMPVNARENLLAGQGMLPFANTETNQQLFLRMVNFLADINVQCGAHKCDQAYKFYLPVFNKLLENAVAEVFSDYIKNPNVYIDPKLMALKPFKDALQERIQAYQQTLQKQQYSFQPQAGSYSPGFHQPAARPVAEVKSAQGHIPQYQFPRQ